MSYTGTGTSCSPDRRNFAGPWVTSVGGTVGGITSDQPEVANIISGGGFSTYFDRQGYQENAVNAFFLNLGDKYPGLYECVLSRGLTKPILSM